MQTKLTLRLDSRLIRQAKSYARKSGKSVSEIVADFFTRLHQPDVTDAEELSPSVQSLLGALRGGRVSEDDYRRYQADKHR